jgi:hypothetical protein
MFESVVRHSEAMRAAGETGGGTLIPALSGCRSCRTIQMIAAPVLGVCPECGGPLSVLDRTDAPGGDAQALQAAA